MSKITGVIIGVVAVSFVGLTSWALIQKQQNPTGAAQYDQNRVISENSDNGNIADHVRGNKDADIIIVEYADYQCSGCASVSGAVEELAKKYGDKVGFVQRSYVLSYHQNGKAAAAATEAAAKQGYWEKYGALLFKNQAEWFYSDSEERTAQFQEYFKIVTGGKGDMEKFNADMASSEVLAKIKFDESMAKKAGEISYTPAFFIDGKFIDWANNSKEDTPYKNTDKVEFKDYMAKIIEEKLAEK